MSLIKQPKKLPMKKILFKKRSIEEAQAAGAE